MARQTAFWPLIEIYNTAAHKSRQKARKRSEKRQRTQRVTIRLLPAERAEFTTAAQALNISEAELVRWIVLHYLRVSGAAHLITDREMWIARTYETKEGNNE